MFLTMLLALFTFFVVIPLALMLLAGFAYLALWLATPNSSKGTRIIHHRGRGLPPTVSYR